MTARCCRWLGLFRGEFCGNAVHTGLPFGEFAIVGWLCLAKLCRVPIGDAAGLKVAKCGFKFGQAVDHAEQPLRRLGAVLIGRNWPSALVSAKRLGLGIGIFNVPQLEPALIGIAAGSAWPQIILGLMSLAKASIARLLNSDNAHRVASALIQSNVTLG